MIFKNFPMDTQTCSLDIESCKFNQWLFSNQSNELILFLNLDGHNTDGMILHWKDPLDSVMVSSDSTLNQFENVHLKEATEMIQLISGKILWNFLIRKRFYLKILYLANYSRLNIDFEFKRLTGYYCVQVYTPCTMLFIISYITFWLNRRAHNVRLVLCALSMLLMACGVSFVTSQVPRTHYTKALDIYTGVVMTFIFYALVGKFMFYFRFNVISICWWNLSLI